MADDTLVERVLRAVEQVPSGSVVSYGDLGAIVGIGPRHVGNVLARWGSGVPWWRVTNRDGELPQPLLAQAVPHWETEGVTQRADGRGCRIAAHRADLAELASRWEQSVADLPR